MNPSPKRPTLTVVSIFVATFSLLAAACSVDSEVTTDEAAESTTATAEQQAEATTSSTAPASSAPIAPSLDTPVGDAILTEAATGGIAFEGGESYPFEEVGIDSDIPAALGVFNGEQVIVIPIDDTGEAPTGQILLTAGGSEDKTEATDVTISTIEIEGFGESGIEASGTLEIDGTPTTFALTLPLGVGSSTFEVNGNEATVRGSLGIRAFQQVEYLVAEHPEVDTLILADIPGSLNDEVNVNTGRLVRKAGYTTHVPADGEIYSGGVDLFASGAQRAAEEGSVVGVHSWCCADSGEAADELSQTDPAHDDQLAYFTEMLGAALGPAFYFFTLQASPFDKTEDMTAAEREHFGLTNTGDVLAEPIDRTSRIGETVKGSTFNTPAEVATAVIDALATDNIKAETLLVLDGEPSTVIIASSELADDSISGEILTLTLDPDDSLGWGLDEATGTAICARGVSAGACT
ncbi:MAG: hypothetical protein ACRBK7_23485 [Acidimicrobiales bacterium]